jgi:hypothetical protein
MVKPTEEPPITSKVAIEIGTRVIPHDVVAAELRRKWTVGSEL